MSSFIKGCDSIYDDIPLMFALDDASSFIKPTRCQKPQSRFDPSAGSASMLKKARG